MNTVRSILYVFTSISNEGFNKKNFFWEKSPKKGQFYEKIEKLPWDVNADKMVDELTFGELWWLKSSLAQDSLPDWGSLLSSGEKKRRIIP